MAKKRMDSRSVGLDVAAEFAAWLTGAENLHYGIWSGLEVDASNLGAAQAAYTAKLFAYLPDGPLSILDIGGGAGETPKETHRPRTSGGNRGSSHSIADRCRENVPEARVHEVTFEEFEDEERFDLCLFSESLQYIPLKTALEEALKVTRRDGCILIADCFRSEGFATRGEIRPPGDGHPIASFRKAVAALPLEQLASEDITEAVAPSIDLEQGLYHVFGKALARIDLELATKRPKTRWVTAHLLKLTLGRRRVVRLNARLSGDFRTSEAFIRNSIYLVTLLRKHP
ncbi:methyltransferase domain-containing protein [Roseitranquillus sediminis]|uniref:methyltransferase domain-containing protein n=1 Tax=Roseitranquillus sediminis TaxID=2809051 RepID=UPI001D0CA1CA|nr:methyltransferase domain-containing protein [Roseitranquillus sediminis]